MNEAKLPQVKDIIYVKLGLQLAREAVYAKYPDAEVIYPEIELRSIQPDVFGYYISSPSKGISLSPLCTDENSAWIFAAIFVSSSFSNQTLLEDGVLDEKL